MRLFLFGLLAGVLSTLGTLIAFAWKSKGNIVPPE